MTWLKVAYDKILHHLDVKQAPIHRFHKISLLG